METNKSIPVTRPPAPSNPWVTLAALSLLTVVLPVMIPVNVLLWKLVIG